MVAAVLFDLDGTLLDTAPDLGAALNVVLQANGRQPLADEKMRPYASHGSTGLLTLGFGQDFSHASDAEKNRLRKQFLAAYEANICQETCLFQGVSELLQTLAQRKIAAGIVTNKPTHYTQLVLRYFPELAQLPSIVCGDTLSVNKPNPAPIRHAADLLQVAYQHCLYVGDAERDIVAGRNAGMTTVLAEYGYLAEHDQTATWFADHSIATPLDILQVIAPQ
ncbi:MAG: HAD-IA family hydrolase [Aliidiomarina sp.]|uniref:HAD family hydrolase n=1 Tax=Aliidiomarina sp. TaxID=1872439 RepID=UPI0025BA8EBF|nr:HAD-IA family hydrolase [Aliidiomarina sp.]MCH8500343.1 HAD-IA family hydrolase [Aliidiomarina sp.]